MTFSAVTCRVRQRNEGREDKDDKSFLCRISDLAASKKNENRNNERTRDYECEDASNYLRPLQLFSTTLHHRITAAKNSRF